MDTDTNIFLTDTNMDTIWNLEPDTDNYPDPEVIKFQISMTLKYIDDLSIDSIQN
jgi:hypothetical protein